jgi:hypothetical protein
MPHLGDCMHSSFRICAPLDSGSRYIDQKVHVNLANVTQGPAGNTGSRLRQKLASQGKRLPLLGDNDDTANRAYTKQFALSRDLPHVWRR